MPNFTKDQPISFRHLTSDGSGYERRYGVVNDGQLRYYSHGVASGTGTPYSFFIEVTTYTGWDFDRQEPILGDDIGVRVDDILTMGVEWPTNFKVGPNGELGPLWAVNDAREALR